MSSQAGDFNVLTFSGTLQPGFSYLTVALIACVVALTESLSLSQSSLSWKHNTVWLSFQHRCHLRALIWSHTVDPSSSEPESSFFCFCNPVHPINGANCIQALLFSQWLLQLYKGLCAEFSGVTILGCLEESSRGVQGLNLFVFLFSFFLCVLNPSVLSPLAVLLLASF